MKKLRCSIRGLSAILLNLTFISLALGQTVTITPYKSGFINPIVIGHAGDDRLFVGERNGRIRVIDAAGNVLATPFLDITSKISSLNSEEGFLGMVFSPDYATSGKFYVSYTDSLKSNEPGGPLLFSVVEEYKVSSGNPNLADPSSALIIDTVHQPFQNHNGGNLLFGPDGYLYIGFGDGGNGGDPFRNGQSLSVKLGKMLRINVSNSSMATPYTVPSGNPFVSTAGAKPEIWAYGLRNPWRTSFDRITGDLWIADVGQDAHEEVDFQAAASTGGENYGWNIMEGFSCYSPMSGCNMSGLTLPIFDYNHTVGASITGGYVYRSIQSRDFWGMYIFGDFVRAWIDGLTRGSGAPTVVRLTSSPGGQPISFGQDRYGELYICFYNNGTIYKLEDGNANRFPKAYFTSLQQGPMQYQLQGLEGRNVTYQWLLDNVAIPGATNANYTATLPGSYTLQVTNTIGNSDMSTAFSLAALPVGMKSFEARRNSNGIVELAWVTSSEQNNTGFEIQRGGTASRFDSLTFVRTKADNGNSIRDLSYAFIDAGAPSSTLYYRLRQIDKDGKFSYSDIRMVNDAPGTDARLKISPNPASDQVVVSWRGIMGATKLTVRNVQGAKMKQYAVNGENFNLGLKYLANGVYVIQISDAAGKVLDQQKLVKE